MFNSMHIDTRDMIAFPLSNRSSGIVAALVALGYGFVTIVWVVAPAYLGAEGFGALTNDPIGIVFWAGITIDLTALAAVPTYLLLRHTIVLPSIVFLALQGTFAVPEVIGTPSEPLMGYVPLLPVYLVGLLVLGWIEYAVRRRLGNGWLPRLPSL